MGCSMNIIILFLGLFFIVVASIIILLNNGVKITSTEEEIGIIDDINMVSSHPAKSKIYFENILNNIDNIDNIDNKQETLPENQGPLLNTPNKELVLIDDNFNNIHNIDHKVKIKDKAQNYSYESIIELSKSGLKIEEIAKITNKGIREVEIILKFQNKKSNS